VEWFYQSQNQNVVHIDWVEWFYQLQEQFVVYQDWVEWFQKVSSPIGQPPEGDTPSVPLQAQFKGINQQSNRSTEKIPACDAAKHIMSSVTQNDISGAASTPST
jgi:hypothetical protein